jgi:hypothetical protein
MPFFQNKTYNFVQTLIFFLFQDTEVNVLCLKAVQGKIGRFVIGRFVTEMIRTCSLTLHA